MIKTQNKEVRFADVGLIDYEKAHNLQKEYFDATVALKLANRKTGEEIPTSNHMLFCEHPHVYTLGKSGDRNHLLINDAFLKQINATYYEIGRGGDITYHGPGQIVGYPILDLDNFFTDIHKYLRLLEDAIILTMADYGLDGGRIEGLTGVWLDHVEKKKPRKICAMGVRASRWVTMHGFAFNVNTDLTYFNHIVPCGIKDKEVTSLQQELGRPLDIAEVKRKLLGHISALFEMKLI